jgi:hypothetical protein
MNHKNLPPESTAQIGIDAINPLPVASVEGKQCRRDLRNHKYSSEHHTKSLLNIKKSRNQVR